MINSVSFGATDPSTFQDMISKPQAYPQTTKPAAASTLAGAEKDSFAKKTGKVIVGLGVAATAVALTSKFGGFEKLISKIGNKNGFAQGANTVLGYVDKAGKYILQGVGIAKNKAVDLYHTVAEKVAQKAPDAVETVVEATV